jgi:hypothetical protein
VDEAALHRHHFVPHEGDGVDLSEAGEPLEDILLREGPGLQGLPLCTVKRTLVLAARSSESIFSIRMLLEWRF